MWCRGCIKALFISKYDKPSKCSIFSSRFISKFHNSSLPCLEKFPLIYEPVNACHPLRPSLFLFLHNYSDQRHYYLFIFFSQSTWIYSVLPVVSRRLWLWGTLRWTWWVIGVSCQKRRVFSGKRACSASRVTEHSASGLHTWSLPFPFVLAEKCNAVVISIASASSWFIFSSSTGFITINIRVGAMDVLCMVSIDSYEWCFALFECFYELAA